MQTKTALHVLMAAILAVPVAVSIPEPLLAKEHAEQCASPTVSAMLDRAATAPIHLTCSVTLPKGSTISRNLVIEGSGASGVTLDCNGGTIDTSKGAKFEDKVAIAIRSRQQPDGKWDAPQSITVKNCTIKGFVRIYGLDINANGANMRASSLRPDHIKYARDSAPRNVSLRHITFVAAGSIPLYVGPGVTHASVSNSTFRGQASATAIYLDAESGWNEVRDNRFSLASEKRELIAIDGSRNNRIVGNVFENPVNGGIFIYRNCGEAGVIRHQKPQYNLIADNVFEYRKSSKTRKPAIWLGSRGGKQRYCFHDPERQFGSSADSGDFARNNIVEDNRVVGGGRRLIRNGDPTNVVRGNRFD
jgi:hypothetical protein